MTGGCTGPAAVKQNRDIHNMPGFSGDATAHTPISLGHISHGFEDSAGRSSREQYSVTPIELRCRLAHNRLPGHIRLTATHCKTCTTQYDVYMGVHAHPHTFTSASRYVHMLRRCHHPSPPEVKYTEGHARAPDPISSIGSPFNLPLSVQPVASITHVTQQPLYLL
jgi:hypothetical protein